MGRTCAAARAVLAAAAISAPCAAAHAQSAAPLAILGVAVIDVATGQLLRDRDVVVRDGRIAAVGRAGQVSIPADARRIDGHERYLIPGLWDMHVHLGIAGHSALASLVAEGVTGVRDMGGDGALVRAWRDSIAAGTLRGPRIVPVALVVENGTWLARAREILAQRGWLVALAEIADRVGVSTREDARESVRRAAQDGSRLLKVRTSPPAPAYFTLLREAQAAHLRVVGHDPDDVSLADASDSGQASIEHTPTAHVGDTISPALAVLDDGARAALFARLARNKTALVPTIVAFLRDTSVVADTARADSTSSGEAAMLVREPRLAEFWREELAAETLDRIDWRAIAARSAPYLREAARAGVPVLAGTDLGAPYVYPGRSLHDELVLLVRAARLTPAEALRAATLAPAQFLGLDAESGVVAPGKRADLVLLRANPLADITRTRQIAMVIANGVIVRDERAPPPLRRAERR